MIAQPEGEGQGQAAGSPRPLTAVLVAAARNGSGLRFRLLRRHTSQSLERSHNRYRAQIRDSSAPSLHSTRAQPTRSPRPLPPPSATTVPSAATAPHRRSVSSSLEPPSSRHDDAPRLRVTLPAGGAIRIQQHAGWRVRGSAAPVPAAARAAATGAHTSPDQPAASGTA